MSLINDALKRVKEAQPATAPTPEPDQPMQPAEPQTEPPHSKSLPPYFLPAVLIVMSGACWFLINGWEAKRQAGLYPTPIVVHAREATPETGVAPTTDAQKAPSNPTQTPSRNVAEQTGSPSPTTSNSTIAAVETPTSQSKPEMLPRPQLTFKLQGIFYRPSNPSAVVNTKTVFIGDVVNEAKVTAIDRQSVTLVLEGQTKVLTLP
jgi:hypothetical protein